MRKTIWTAALITAFVATPFAQQKPPEMPKPGAEQKNLARFAGTWKMEGKMEASPFGPGGPISGSETCRIFEGGWHLICESSGTSPMGAMKGHSIMTYDRMAKRYRYFAVSNVMPDAEYSTGTKTPTGWSWTSTMDMGGGKKLHSRFVIVEKSPTVMTYTWEMSEDGKTWKKAMEGTSTKTGS